MLKAILQEIVPSLRALGFKGSGQSYRKVSGDAVLVVNFQKSTGGDRFYVNLAVQPLFVPMDAGGYPDPRTIKEYECIFRRRVEPPDKMLGWPYRVSPELVEELRLRISSAYHEYLVPLATFPGVVTELTAKEFKTLPSDHMIGPSPRTVLHLARIALARGSRAKAIEFAEMGLAETPPMAASLRADLRKTLSAANDLPDEHNDA